jgi:very-short-patch-repair endonuclease
MRGLTDSNNLKAKYPEVAKEWHPTKNGDLKPSEVTYGSAKYVWWKCKFGCEYKTRVKTRSEGHRCPYCSGQKVGFGNDFESHHPELAKEWHPTKNGNLKPSQFTHRSGRSFWWICKAGHSWKTRIQTRAMGRGCPKCTSQTSKPEIYFYSELLSIFKNVHHRKKIGKNEVDIFISDINLAIEYDGRRWHDGKLKKDKNKKKAIEELGIDIINIREKPLEKINKNDIIVNSKDSLEKRFLEFLLHLTETNLLNKKFLKDINQYIKDKKMRNEDLYLNLLSHLPGPLPGESFESHHPKLAKEWHPTKNGNLKPSQISKANDKKVWWICEFGHEYQSSVNSRDSGTGCPYCSNSKVGYGNDLQTHFPEIAKEWHPTKNGSLTPDKSPKATWDKRWWMCSKGHEWEASVAARTRDKTRCPYCSNNKIGYGNDFESHHPKLAKEWHPTKNGNLKPSQFTPGSQKYFWWKCSQGHEWKAPIHSRSIGYGRCKECKKIKKSK